MKLRKILKSMFNNYCKTFKDVPPVQYVPITKKPAPAGFFVSLMTVDVTIAEDVKPLL